MTVTSTSPTPLAPADLSRIAQDLQIRRTQVESVVQLLDEANTIPFITRYRKERTGGLDEEVLRAIQDRVHQIRALADRKQTVLKSIETQERLTDELKAAILAAETPRRLEDLYLPYKPRKKTLASEARDRGLEPLAVAIWMRDPIAANLDELWPTLVDPEKGLATAEEVKAGVGHIFAELVAETADVRAAARRLLWDFAKLVVARSERLPEGKGLEYKDYFEFADPVGRIPPHRILAINRGERENALMARLDFDAEAVRQAALAELPQLVDHPHAEYLRTAVSDALSRLLLPALEREIRRELTDFAQGHAVQVFARNLRGLLLQPPLRGRRVLAIDPGFRSGCKLAVLDETGRPLADGVMFPHPPQKRTDDAKYKLAWMIGEFQTSVIVIGNGTACRETEEFVAGVMAELEKYRKGEAPAPVKPPPPPPKPRPQPKPAPAVAVAASELPPPLPGAVVVTPPPLETPVPPPADAVVVIETPLVVTEAPPVAVEPPELFVDQTAPEPVIAEPPPPPPSIPPPPPPPDMAYIIVNEAGASEYSASPAGREEFPELDATLRGTISIGRRLQDPLAELVKIDPQHVGVGLYQHDVHGKHLKGALEGVIESCVNHVGVELNTASEPLLRHVAGFNQLVARELVEYRKANGPFRTREDIAKVPSIGPVRYTQAAGFLKIPDGEDPLDATWIHPESYAAARQILADLGFTPADLRDKTKLQSMHEKFMETNVDEIAERLSLGAPTVIDILHSLARPGRDPREDLPPPVFRHDVLRIEDLSKDMELKGTILNVVDFGAFVDVGLKDSGLVHISQLANRFIRNPHEVVTVGDVVTVWVMAVDHERHRVSLTMIAPGTPKEVPQQQQQNRRSFGPSKEGGDRPSRPQQNQGQGQRPQRQDQRRRPPRQDGPPDDQSSPQQHRRSFERKPPAAPKPLPTLTQEKKDGKAYLNTLGELEAFFKQREKPPAE